MSCISTKFLIVEQAAERQNTKIDSPISELAGESPPKKPATSPQKGNEII